MSGEYVKLPGGQVRLMLTDLNDPTLQIVVRSAQPGERGPVLAFIRNGQLGCVATATVSQTITASCGKTQVEIRLLSTGQATSVSGWLIVKGN